MTAATAAATAVRERAGEALKPNRDIPGDAALLHRLADDAEQLSRAADGIARGLRARAVEVVSEFTARVGLRAEANARRPRGAPEESSAAAGPAERRKRGAADAGERRDRKKDKR